MSLTTEFSDLRKKPIAVIGSGAVGRAVACMLSHTGHDVTLVGREDSISYLQTIYDRDAGMTFRAPDLAGDVKVPMSFLSSERVSQSGYRPGIAIYTTKSGYLPEVIQTTNPMIGEETKTLFLQGGVQWWCGYVTTPDMHDVTDPQNIGGQINLDNAYAGLVSFGADVLPGAPEISRLKSNNLLTLGAIKTNDGSERTLAGLRAIFNNNLIQPKISDKLFPALWAKAAGSFAMSSYALITGKTLGAMVDDEPTFEAMVSSASLLQDAGTKLGVPATTDYRKYLFNMGATLRDHMMTITKDPNEHGAIIDMPIRIATALGTDTTQLESIAAQSRAAAQRIKVKSRTHAP